MLCLKDFNLNFLYFGSTDSILQTDSGTEFKDNATTMTNSLIQNDENSNHFIKHLCILKWVQIRILFICDISNFLFTPEEHVVLFVHFVICLVLLHVAQIYFHCFFFRATPCARFKKCNLMAWLYMWFLVVVCYFLFVFIYWKCFEHVCVCKFFLYIIGRAAAAVVVAVMLRISYYQQTYFICNGICFSVFFFAFCFTFSLCATSPRFDRVKYLKYRKRKVGQHALILSIPNIKYTVVAN